MTEYLQQIKETASFLTGQGRDTVKQLITDNPELAIELEAKIRGKIAEVQVVE